MLFLATLTLFMRQVDAIPVSTIVTEGISRRFEYQPNPTPTPPAVALRRVKDGIVSRGKCAGWDENPTGPSPCEIGSKRDPNRIEPVALCVALDEPVDIVHTASLDHSSRRLGQGDTARLQTRRWPSPSELPYGLTTSYTRPPTKETHTTVISYRHSEPDRSNDTTLGRDATASSLPLAKTIYHRNAVGSRGAASQSGSEAGDGWSGADIVVVVCSIVIGLPATVAGIVAAYIAVKQWRKEESSFRVAKLLPRFSWRKRESASTKPSPWFRSHKKEERRCLPWR
ncbi:hypothetical protein GGS23DRAFT_317414 [Durotheca rogersii]|uniref:uncharacterized protein n=1 Tax=Durotheca rogersii TaxID=419775 RepID=UPI00221ECE8B|nr:uncharacterized protein GGS23DRAFT_317414 [Durotheca rogersii]KAI5859434.1 hypothetical protein GGS23DRAFT_317414 [Durotheca rogersii]